MIKRGRKPGGTNKVKKASKIIKLHELKDHFNKTHSDELNDPNKERIKNNVEDGENFGSI